MIIERMISGMSVVVVSVAAMTLAGCAMEAEDVDAIELEEDIAQEAQAFGAECAAASPTVTAVGTVNYTSPQTYSTTNCVKAVVVDVSNYKTGAPLPPTNDGLSYSFSTFVSWADAVPGSSTLNHEAICNSMLVRVDLFEVINGVPVFKTTRTSLGQWIDGDLFSLCEAPALDLTSQMQAGKKYRIAASARSSSASTAPTRKVNVNASWSGVAIPK
jgi:hypothetical protein